MLHFSRFSVDFGPLRAKIRTLITEAAEHFETYGLSPSRKSSFLFLITIRMKVHQSGPLLISKDLTIRQRRRELEKSGSRFVV